MEGTSPKLKSTGHRNSSRPRIANYIDYVAGFLVLVNSFALMRLNIKLVESTMGKEEGEGWKEGKEQTQRRKEGWFASSFVRLSLFDIGEGWKEGWKSPQQSCHCCKQPMFFAFVCVFRGYPEIIRFGVLRLFGLRKTHGHPNWPCYPLRP